MPIAVAGPTARPCINFFNKSLMLCIRPIDPARIVMPYLSADTRAFAMSKQSSTIGFTNL